MVWVPYEKSKYIDCKLITEIPNFIGFKIFIIYLLPNNFDFKLSGMSFINLIFPNNISILSDDSKRMVLRKCRSKVYREFILKRFRKKENGLIQ